MTKYISTIAFLLMASAAHADSVLTDGQITKALVTINEGEIDAAKLALKKAKNEEVKAFADTMAKEHSTNRTATKELEKRVGIKEATSTLSTTLFTSAKTNNTKVRAAKAEDFDKAYVDEQIKMHQSALDNIDQKFLIDVKNADLKAHIEKTRSAVAMHLDHAKALRTKL